MPQNDTKQDAVCCFAKVDRIFFYNTRYHKHIRLSIDSRAKETPGGFASAYNTRYVEYLSRHVVDFITAFILIIGQAYQPYLLYVQSSIVNSLNGGIVVLGGLVLSHPGAINLFRVTAF